MDTRHAPQADRNSSPRWPILALVTFTSFFLLLGDTALSVALPSARADLNASLPSLLWVVNSYALALASLLLLGGRLSDMLGPRRVYLVGLSVFTLASLGAGLSPSVTPLLVARIVQGVGAALLLPAILAIIVWVFPAPHRAVALGIWAGVSAAALALGPIIGAGLAASLGWQWLFFVNVPAGVIALLIGAWLIPADRPLKRSRLDLPGVVTSGLGLAAILYALTQLSAQSWTSPTLLASFAFGIASLVLFVFIERRRAQPLLDLSILRYPNLAAANGIGLLSQTVMCGMFFFMSLYLQVSLGYSTLAAGLTFLPLTVPLVIVAPLAGALTRRLGPRVLVAGGLALLAAALAVLAGGAANGNLWIIIPSFFASGVGIGLSTTPTTTAALEPLPESHFGQGSGLLNTSRTVGLVLGIALMGALTTMGPPGSSENLSDTFTAELPVGLAVFAALAAGTALAGVVFLRRSGDARGD